MAGQIPDSNKNVNWNTPEWVVKAVKQVYGGTIDLDPCSNPGSIVGAEKSYSLPKVNGLEQDWSEAENVYINPPYGRCFLHKKTLTLLDPKEWKNLPKERRAEYHDTSVEDWIEKAADTQYEYGNNFTLLIPAYVNAKYFQEHVFGRAQAVCFPEGRFKFLGAPSTAAFHVCIPFYGAIGLVQEFKSVFTELGHTVVVL